jgi:hypothetical protein
VFRFAKIPIYTQMNVIKNLRLILSQDLLTRKEFDFFKNKYFERKSTLKSESLIAMISIIEKEFEKKKIISTNEIKTHPFFLNFMKAKNLPKSKESKTKKKKRTGILRTSKKDEIKYSKKQAERLLKILHGVRKTENQDKARKINEEANKSSKEWPIKMINSIWTVKKK